MNDGSLPRRSRTCTPEAGSAAALFATAMLQDDQDTSTHHQRSQHQNHQTFLVATCTNKCAETRTSVAHACWRRNTSSIRLVKHNHPNPSENSKRSSVANHLRNVSDELNSGLEDARTPTDMAIPMRPTGSSL